MDNSHACNKKETLNTLNYMYNSSLTNKIQPYMQIKKNIPKRKLKKCNK